MQPKRILILGGTREARELANRLVGQGCDVTTSFAGVTDNPVLPKGKIRQGGFGGVDGLSAYLKSERFDHVIDATHPFAAQISAHAAQACAATRTPLLRMERTDWIAEQGDHWISAKDFIDARECLPQGARVMLTLGRKEVSTFFARGDLTGVARMIEPPDDAVPSSFKLVLQRPPFTLDEEMELLRDYAVQFLLCKNSGGPRAEKLYAARELSINVIMVERPNKPAVPTVSNIDEALALLLGRAGHTG